MAADRRSPSQPKPEKVTEEGLREAALGYVERHGGSVHQVRVVLQRRIDTHAPNEERRAAMERAELLLERFVASRILDDRRLAESLAESWRRRGASVAKVCQKLRTRRIAPELIEEAVSRFEDDDELSDLASACAYARKRRLQERYDLSDRAQRQKALASLARQGFPFEVARQALDLAPISEDTRQRQAKRARGERGA